MRTFILVLTLLTLTACTSNCVKTANPRIAVFVERPDAGAMEFSAAAGRRVEHMVQSQLSQAGFDTYNAFYPDGSKKEQLLDISRAMSSGIDITAIISVVPQVKKTGLGQ